jgi:ribosomal protein S27AE
MTRFDDGGRYLAELLDHADVRCPACGRRAVMTSGTNERLARVVCRSCPYTASFEETGWLGPMRGSVKRRCGLCGQWLERRFHGPRPPRVVHLVCACGFEFDEEVTRQRETTGPVDPVFGLPLWLTTRFRSKVVWAYNVEHLQFLRDYVTADLRQRVPNRNSSLASRLPAWMKSAKNRAGVLSALDELGEQAGAT